MNTQKLYDLKISDFKHPLEASSFKTLQKTRGLEKVVKKFYDMGVENVIKLQYTGSSLRLSPTSFPELRILLETACEMLDVDNIPELYVERSEDFTAATLGVDKPIIAISSECLDKLTKPELLFLLGREVTHIKCQHVLYQEIGFIFPELMDALSGVTLGLSGVLSTGLKYALFHWMQMAEYTADRGGLLVCQDTFAVKQLFSKIAGLPEKYWATFDINELESQAKAFDGFSEKSFDKFVRFLYGNNLWAIARAHEIIQWVESGDYSKIIAKKSKSNRIGGVF
ncbi:MAG: Zn-dependent protease with chaperone function [Saprospiraceae bacterium]|jgi:Zn-dependent protease with chaperone function